MNTKTFAAVSLAATLFHSAAHAATPEPDPSRSAVSSADTALGVDSEIDPLAYALGGASVHGGLHVGHVRFDLGVFSLVLPEALHGNPGFTAQGHGYGLKADWFPRDGNTGLHVGAQVDITHQTVTHNQSTESELYREFATGGRVGYRFQHRSGLYVNPWIGGIYRVTSPTEIALGGQTFEQSKIMPFPTLHIGWRL